MPERFLEERFISVIGGRFVEQFCCGIVNHELLKFFTDAKALKSSACSVLVLHADLADAERERIRKKLKRILSFIFLWERRISNFCYHFVGH